MFKSFGVDLSFNYNILSMHQPNNEKNLPFFQWNNGVYELPMSVLHYKNFVRDLDFNNLNNFIYSDMAYDFIDQYYKTFPVNAVAVMIMHSWSFCHRDEVTRHRVFKDNSLVDNFDRFLANLPADVEIVTASDIHRSISSGELRTDIVRNIELTDKITYRGRIL